MWVYITLHPSQLNNHRLRKIKSNRNSYYTTDGTRTVFLFCQPIAIPPLAHAYPIKFQKQLFISIAEMSNKHQQGRVFNRNELVLNIHILKFFCNARGDIFVIIPQTYLPILSKGTLALHDIAR